MAASSLAQITDNVPVAWSDNHLTVGGTAVNWHYVHDWWPMPKPAVHYHYGNMTYWNPPSPNPTEAAFKIVGKMMEQGLVGEMDVTQFVKFVNDVAEIVRTT